MAGSTDPERYYVGRRSRDAGVLALMRPFLDGDSRHGESAGSRPPGRDGRASAGFAHIGERDEPA
jgi:hypothetical protein